MSESFVTIKLRTQPATGDFTLQHYRLADQRISKRAALHVVEAMQLPDGLVIENPNHSLITPLLSTTGEARTESLTLPVAKATRLVNLFQKLQPEHGLQCHDVIIQFEGWDYDRGLQISHKLVQPPEFVLEPENIKSGKAYTVQLVDAVDGRLDFVRSHSAIGTNDGRLLSLMGEGLVMSTMDPDTTRDLYASGADTSLLARSIIPE